MDTSALEKENEIQIVRDHDLIAVLHPFPDVADKALSQVKAEFDLPDDQFDGKTIFEHLLNVAPAGETVTQGGNVDEGERMAREAFETTYLNHYVAHATIETHTALAKVDKDGATVWASTQSPFRAKEEVAQALGISSEKVRIITPFVGAGFGGKNYNQQTVEAARLAKLTGRPVQVAWSRERRVLLRYFPTRIHREDQIRSDRVTSDRFLEV